ncbi:hypothetical protein FOVG_06868 [Fusarium oxysporum f. sp. pisi HDV247]|uniref:Uncharacterized protein n=1 Tax=Fusarium oxysporum f. sp. pisi HDV247 TaxID=1080344 RepID=W9PUY5_FUSOX|nr:hypothetical protein FOVG_06868 [Fusarium oxysporum f. sp. pisi HDV247]
MSSFQLSFSIVGKLTTETSTKWQSFWASSLAELDSLLWHSSWSMAARNCDNGTKLSKASEVTSRG